MKPLIDFTKQTIKKLPAIGPFMVTVQGRLRATRRLRATQPTTKLNLVESFPLFAPSSAGTYEQTWPLVVEAVNSVINLLGELAWSTNGNGPLEAVPISAFPNSLKGSDAALKLKKFFDIHGSDKANFHGYHVLYGSILCDPESILSMLEIGLGTNNSDVVSNMGPDGTPGASLRAFRDFLPNAKIYGADIDRRVLFEEEKIETFYVDQTSRPSLQKLGASIPLNLDLVIDDGLHSPHANIATLEFGLRHIKVDGWVVIEDIASRHLPVWQVVALCSRVIGMSYILCLQIELSCLRSSAFGRDEPGMGPLFTRAWPLAIPAYGHRSLDA